MYLYEAGQKDTQVYSYNENLQSTFLKRDRYLLRRCTISRLEVVQWKCWNAILPCFQSGRLVLGKQVWKVISYWQGFLKIDHGFFRVIQEKHKLMLSVLQFSIHSFIMCIELILLTFFSAHASIFRTGTKAQRRVSLWSFYKPST